MLEGGVLTFFKDSKSSNAVGLVRPGPPRQGSPHLLPTPAFTTSETEECECPGSWAFGRGVTTADSPHRPPPGRTAAGWWAGSWGRGALLGHGGCIPFLSPVGRQQRTSQPAGSVVRKSRDLGVMGIPGPTSPRAVSPSRHCSRGSLAGWSQGAEAALSELRAPSPFPSLPQRQPSKLSTPEYTVDLKGASLSWAPKDKSSKKNVLEVSCGGGETERGLAGGLGLKLGKPQVGAPGQSWGWNSQAQSQRCPLLRGLPTASLAPRALQFPLQELSSPVLGSGR